MDFMFRMRHLIAQNVIATCETTNCQVDDDEHLVPVEILSSFITEELPPPDEISKFHDAEEEINIKFHNEDMGDVTAYKLNTSAYVAGYVATKLLEKHDCEFYKADLVDANKTLSESTVFILSSLRMLLKVFVFHRKSFQG